MNLWPTLPVQILSPLTESKSTSSIPHQAEQQLQLEGVSSTAADKEQVKLTENELTQIYKLQNPVERLARWKFQSFFILKEEKTIFFAPRNISQSFPNKQFVFHLNFHLIWPGWIRLRESKDLWLQTCSVAGRLREEAVAVRQDQNRGLQAPDQHLRDQEEVLSSAPGLWIYHWRRHSFRQGPGWRSNMTILRAAIWSLWPSPAPNSTAIYQNIKNTVVLICDQTQSWAFSELDSDNAPNQRMLNRYTALLDWGLTWVLTLFQSSDFVFDGSSRAPTRSPSVSPTTPATHAGPTSRPRSAVIEQTLPSWPGIGFPAYRRRGRFRSNSARITGQKKNRFRNIYIIQFTRYPMWPKR